MKKTNLLCLFLCLGILIGAPSTIWAQNDYSVDFGTAGNDFLRDVWVDQSDGSVYYAGLSNGIKPLFGKLDNCGNLDGETEYTLPGWTQISSMVRADNGDFLLASQFSGDWLVARVQSNGTLVWVKRYHLTLERSVSIIKSIGDTYIIGGWYAQFGISDDATVIKIDGNGNQMWATRLNQGDDQTYELHSNGTGGVIIAGAIHGGGVNAFIAEVDNAGNYVGGKRIDRTNNDFYEITDVVKTADGGYATLGRSSLNQAAHNYRVLVFKKFDANFNFQWGKNYFISGTMTSQIQTITEDLNGDLFASGRSSVNGGSSVVLKVDGTNGNLIDGKAFPGVRLLQFQNDQGPSDQLVAGLQITTGAFGSQDAGVLSMDNEMDACNGVSYTPTLVSQPDVISNWNVNQISATFNITDLTNQVTVSNPTLSHTYDCDCCPEIIVDVEDCHEVFPGVPNNMCADLDVLGITGGTPPYTYSWSNGATTQMTTVCPTSTTIYTVTVTDANGCEGMAEVTVHATDVIDHTNNGNNTKVLICHNGMTLSVGAPAVAAHLAHGDNLGPCGSIDPCTGMPKALTTESGKHAHDHGTEFDVHPNPSNGGTIMIDYMLQDGENATMRVYDLSGKEVAVIANGLEGDGHNAQITFDTSELQNGMYIVQMSSAENTVVKRIIINR